MLHPNRTRRLTCCLSTVATMVLTGSAMPAHASERPLEQTLDAPTSAEIRDAVSVQRLMFDAANNIPRGLGALGASPIRARVEPGIGPAYPASGPVALAPRESHPIARGGGPRSMVSLVAGDIRTSRGIEPAGALTVSAPLGCSRVSAAGAPGVRRIALTVTSRDGHSLAHAERAGRIAALRFCPPTDGAYFVRARAVGGTLPDPVQLFVE